MNYAQLNVWDVVVPIGNFKYHDEGYVESIKASIKQIHNEYGKPEPSINFRNVFGFYTRIGLDIHIMYLPRPSIPLDIQNRAHEEFHAIECCNRVDLLSLILKERGKVNINFEDIKDEETRANVGSLYVMDQYGFSPKELGRYLKCKEMINAVKIWNELKPSRRRFLFLRNLNFLVRK
jgi:hypothetical protein